MSGLQTWVRRTLWDVVPRDHRQSTRDLRRRQIVTTGFLMVGAVVLGLSLRITPGNGWFYAATLGLAGVWAVGAFASGPLHLGRIARADRTGRPVLSPVAVGLALGTVFVVGALLVKELSFLHGLRGEVEKVIDFADHGSLVLVLLVTLVNGVAEELFFRGAAYAAITRHPVAWTTLAYTIATAVAGNLMLALAAALLGLVVGLERRASGGILGPVLTHCTWSIVMLIALPAIFL